MDHTVAGKAAKLIRLLGSDKPGEVLGAARALRRVLAAEGKDLHGLAAIIEQLNDDANDDIVRRA